MAAMAVWKNNSLSIALFLLFAGSLAGHSLAGWKVYNAERQDHGEAEVGYVAFVRTPEFGETVFENWESEFLQMAFYVVLTVFLFQKGSAESKTHSGDEAVEQDPKAHRDDPHAPWPVKRGGWVLGIYQNSLSLALLILFAGSFLAHAASGARKYSEEQIEHGRPPVSTIEYMGEAQFWYESFQNWQSEFLSVSCSGARPNRSRCKHRTHKQVPTSTNGLRLATSTREHRPANIDQQTPTSKSRPAKTDQLKPTS
jgi:hypothetical protein